MSRTARAVKPAPSRLTKAKRNRYDSHAALLHQQIGTSEVYWQNAVLYNLCWAVSL